MTIAKYRRAIDLMEAALGDELVALDPADGECYGFNEVAAAIWQSLTEPKSLEELRDELIIVYDVSEEECTRDLLEVLEDMVGKGLLEKA